MEMVIKILLFLSTVVAVLGQESINVHQGMNVGMHAGLALLISFGVLASCAIGVNVVTRVCAKRLHASD